MARMLVIVGLLAVFALGGPAVAQTQTGDGVQDLAAGIRQVDEGDLEAAVITLDGAVQRLKQERGRQKDLATAHLYLAMAHLGLSQWERARSEMREAWRNNQQLTLDPKKFPPRVIQLYEQTRTDQKQAEATASKPGPSPEAVTQPGPAPSSPVKAEKGGSKALLLILGGVAVAGAGVALAVGGGAADSSTSTLTAAGNFTGVSGEWRGTTSAGSNQPAASIRMTVADNSRIVSFSVDTDVYCIWPGGFGFSSGTIANNSFTLTYGGARGLEARGQFSSPRSVSGTIVSFLGGPTNQNCDRTWTATRQ